MQKHYQDRYLAEDWQTLSERVARELGGVRNYQSFYDEIYNKRFIPAGNTLLAGVKPITPNCCVLGYVTDDNFAEILELSKLLWSSRTGVGYNLSGLSDPVDGLRKLSDANDAIDLGHRPKRGNMAVLNADHPRIREFISCKAVDGEIYNFNISVAVAGKQVPPDLLDYIASCAWRTGDPGLVFLDTASSYGPNVANDLEPITTCVPCGEQFMHAYETCNLGSVNLNAPSLHTKGGHIDIEQLRITVKTGIRLLDTVVDRLVFPTQELERVAKRTRRIGLGVTGWADLLKRHDMAYGSPQSIELAKCLSRLISVWAEEESMALADVSGSCAYSNFHRNISLTCIAPTGGITGLTDNRGYAIEPYFDEATTISPITHIDMQLAWQSGIHNAVSKTINMPTSATVADVKAAYRYALERGCKGITVFRDGCKANQPRAVVRCVGCEN